MVDGDKAINRVVNDFSFSLIHADAELNDQLFGVHENTNTRTIRQVDLHKLVKMGDLTLFLSVLFLLNFNWYKNCEGFKVLNSA